jgi:hypothetical protein
VPRGNMGLEKVSQIPGGFSGVTRCRRARRGVNAGSNAAEAAASKSLAVAALFLCMRAPRLAGEQAAHHGREGL